MKNSERFPYLVVASAFHNGGIVSRHATYEAAEKAARRFRGDCQCGCASVVHIRDYDSLPEHGSTDAAGYGLHYSQPCK